MNAFRPGARRLLAVLLVALLALAVPGVARAADTAQTFVADVKVDRAGGADVTETIGFASAPAEVKQRLSGTESTYNRAEFRFEITNLKVTADGKAVDGAVAQDGRDTVVTVKAAGAKQIVISYHVKGAVYSQADGRTQFRWRVLQGLSTGVDKFSAKVGAPTTTEDVDCKAGDPAAPRTCDSFGASTHDNPVPQFDNAALGANAVVAVTLSYPKGAIAATESLHELWSLDRAFSAGPSELLAALAALLLGGLLLYLLHRRTGRDARYTEPTRVAEFRPVDEGVSEFHVLGDVRPGQVGTLVDERVDPIDVTATILDLAVRGHVLIVEQPRESDHANLDWTFQRRQGARDELRPFEAKLLDAIAPEDGSVVRVSDIGPTISHAIPEVQSDLYDEMVNNGWYDRRPDSTRNTWKAVAWGSVLVALVIAALLVGLTSFGLVGLVLVAIALGLVFVATEMPARTSKGASVLAGLLSLRGELQSHPTDQMPRGREYAELSEVLPYAVVLGGQERWLNALVRADNDPGKADPEDLAWYHAPETWQLQDLPASMDAFITTVAGKLFRRS